MESGLKLLDALGNAGLKKRNSRPRRRACDAARMSRSASPLGSMTTTVPGARMASQTMTSSSRVLPLRVVPPMSTWPTSSLNGSTSGTLLRHADGVQRRVAAARARPRGQRPGTVAHEGFEVLGVLWRPLEAASDQETPCLPTAGSASAPSAASRRAVLRVAGPPPR